MSLKILPAKPPTKEEPPRPSLKVLPASPILPPPQALANKVYAAPIEKVLVPTERLVHIEKAPAPTEPLVVWAAPAPTEKAAKGYVVKPVRKIEPESPQIFDILEFDLGVARDGNEAIPIIWDRIYIMKRDGTVYFRKNDTEKWLDLSMIRFLNISPHTESKFFLKNSAQANKSLTLIVGRLTSLFVEPAMGGAMMIMDTNFNYVDPVNRAKTPAIYNVTCTTANTEYSQALPAKTKKFLIKGRGGALKVCFASGQSGTTFITIAEGGAYFEDIIEPDSLTLYFQSPTAGAIAEIVAWS